MCRMICNFLKVAFNFMKSLFNSFRRRFKNLLALVGRFKATAISGGLSGTISAE